jgi:hypothetical protein
VWQLAAHTATMTTTTTTRIKLTSRNSISYLNATIHLYAFCSLHCFYVYWCCVDKNSTKSENGRIVPYRRFWTQRYGRCKTPIVLTVLVISMLRVSVITISTTTKSHCCCCCW